MKLKDNLVMNENQDGSITLYDLDSDSYYELNEIAAFIYRNVELSDDDLLSKIAQQFNTEGMDIASEVCDMKMHISKEYFE